MRLNHWLGLVGLTTAAVHLLPSFGTFVKPAVAVPLPGSANVSHWVQEAARHFSGRASKKSKSKRKPPKPSRYSASEKDDSYDNGEQYHDEEYNEHNNGGEPVYYPTAAYSQPVYLSGGADYGLGLHKPLLFLLVIPVVLIILLAAVLSIVRASSSAASSTLTQQQQQQENNNNNNNNDNNNNNNAAVVVASNTGTTTYTSPIIIIINATGRASEERLAFTHPTWLSKVLD